MDTRGFSAQAQAQYNTNKETYVLVAGSRDTDVTHANSEKLRAITVINKDTLRALATRNEHKGKSR